MDALYHSSFGYLRILSTDFPAYSRKFLDILIFIRIGSVFFHYYNRSSPHAFLDKSTKA